LGFHEHRTAGVVANTLQELGIAVQTGMGRTGVVGRLGTGRPVVAIRADMDALPIQEAHAVAYASQYPGIMHACGHDAHTAMLLGAASLLAKLPNRPAGQLRFLFQPSEEARDADNKSGAVRMIEAGVLADVDAVIALHVDSEIPAHQIRITPGGCMAASDVFQITLKAAGGHGAFPHLGRDPIYMLAHVLQAIYALRSRRIDPTCPAVISVGTIHTGQAPNVIPVK